MMAAGINRELWQARVRRERDHLLSEQEAAAETAKTDQSLRGMGQIYASGPDAEYKSMLV